MPMATNNTSNYAFASGNYEASSSSPRNFDEIPKDIGSVEEICNIYLEELRDIVKFPSAFALTAVVGFISFLSNLTNSLNIERIPGDKSKFTSFVEEYMWSEKGRDDEIDALYSVLRCGLADSMSFYGNINKFADDENLDIKVCREKLLTDEVLLHKFHASFPRVTIVNNPPSVRAESSEYTFCPKQLLQEVEKAKNKLFNDAKTSDQLEKQILDYVRIQPPIVPYLRGIGDTQQMQSVQQLPTAWSGEQLDDTHNGFIVDVEE